jgi:hypothetical protein
MKSVLVVSEGDQEKGTTTAGAIGFIWVGTGHTFWTAQENRRQIPTRSTGTYSKLLVRITANSSSGNITVRSRKNGANGNLNLTISAGFTGVIEDIVNSDAVAAGDLYCLQYVATGTTGTLTFSVISLVFDATTNCVSKLVAEGYTIATASVTHYLPASGDRSGTTTSEAATQNQVKRAGLAKNLYLFIISNARTTDTVFTLRKNAVDTGIKVTVGPGVVGPIEDTTHTVSVAANDKLNWALTSGTGIESLVFAFISFEYETSTEHFWLSAGCVGATSDLVINANLTHYLPIGGGLTSYTTEADTKLKLRQRCTLSDLLIYVGVNTVTADSTYRIRINAADGNQIITIPASTTGYFVSSGTDVVNPDDEINAQLITGATGTSMTIRQAAITSALTAAPEVVAGTGGGSQGRSPLYRYRRREPEIAIAIVRVRIPLEYVVEKLSVQVPLPYTFVPEKKLIKYASAILTPIARILPLPIRPTPEPPQIKTVRLSIPLTYEVTNLQLKAGAISCSYQVERLITQEEQHKIVATSINFLLFEF